MFLSLSCSNTAATAKTSQARGIRHRPRLVHESRNFQVNGMQGENCAVYGNFFLTDEDVPATDNPIKLLRFRQDVFVKWVL